MQREFTPCAMTMVYRDFTHLKIWVDHYGREFGKENLFVLAHGLTEEVQDIASGCQVIVLPRGDVSGRFDQLRWNLMSAWASFALESYDCVVVGDVDEYVFVDPNTSTDLKAYLAKYHGTHDALNCFALEVFQERNDKALDHSRPIIAQRKFATVNSSYCKPLIVYKPVTWAGGGHASNHPPYLPDGLYMAHLRFFDKETYNEVYRLKVEIMNENGGSDAYRKTFHTSWLRGASYGDRFCRQASRGHKAKLDDLSGELFDALRGNVVPYKRNARLKQFGGFEKDYPSLILPDRFDAILAPNGIK